MTNDGLSTRWILVGLVTGLAGAGVAAPPSAEEASDKWRFTVRPYLWILGLNGTARIQGLPSVKFSSSFGEIMETKDAGGMLYLDGRRGKVGFIVDGLYSKSSDSGVVPPGVPARGNVTSSTVMIAGTYRVLETEDSAVDAILGLRLWSADAKATAFTSPTTSITRSGGTDWVNAQLGFRIESQGAGRLSGSLSTVFAVKDRVTYDIQGALLYKTGASTSVVLGYRYLNFHRQGGSFGIDASLNGPFIGLDYRF